MLRRRPQENSPAKQQEINQTLSANPEEAAQYELLTGQNFAVFGETGRWDDEYVRFRHIQDTDRMVAILDGTIEKRAIEDPDNPERSHQAPDRVIALDKSGRPLKDLAAAFWDLCAKEDSTMPPFDFLNIDRMDWLQRMGYTAAEAESSASKTLDMNAVSQEDIARIRAYFTEGDLPEENWQQAVWDMPTRLDGQNILVLDEVKNSGATLEVATKLIKAAVPEATVSGDYFWTDKTQRTVGYDQAESQYGTVPIWYNRDSVWGRGVGDVDPAYYAHQYEQDPTSDRRKALLAAFVLSAPHHDKETFTLQVDEAYEQLTRDIRRMALHYQGGDLPVIPSPDRPDDNWDERMALVSQKTGYDVMELTSYMRWRAGQNEQ